MIAVGYERKTTTMMRATRLVVACTLMLFALTASAYAAAPSWRVFGGSGPTNIPPKASEVQEVAVDATGGTFTLSFLGQTTAPIAFDASPGAVKTALDALSTVGGSGGTVEVEGGLAEGGGGPYLVRFGGSLAGVDVEQMTSNAGLLAGGAATVTVSTRTGGGTPGTGTLVIYPVNVGGALALAPYAVTIDLPDGITTSASPIAPGWICAPAGAGQSTLSCNGLLPVAPGASPTTLQVPIRVDSAAEEILAADITISGGGAISSSSYHQPITVSRSPAEPGLEAFWAGAFDENGNAETRAGAHPYSASLGFLLNTKLSVAGKVVPAGDLKDLAIDPPVGFVGNPLVTARCPRARPACSSDAVVGRAVALLQDFAMGNTGNGFQMSNVLPPYGSAAQLTFPVIVGRSTTFAQLRPEDYGVSAVSPNLPADYKIYGAFVRLFGRPSASSGAFLTNPTDCPGTTLPTMATANSWQLPIAFDEMSDPSPATTGCEDVPFDPSLTVAATSTVADEASGLDFDLEIPQDGLLDSNAIAQSHLRDVEVDLPNGLAVNPSGATGLEGCSDAQMAPGTDDMPACPDGSRIGSVEATSPLADHAIGGAMYLGTPKSTDPRSGEMFRLWVVARDDRLGVLVKVAGSATADPQTGKLVATFRNNPRLPFDHLSVQLKGGERGLLALPQTCGSRSIGTVLSPWSGTAPVGLSSPVQASAGCGFGFAPAVAAGVANTGARASGDFSFELTRPQGDQWVDGLTARLPQGLLASVKDVPLCSNAQADAGACPESSRIGIVDASAGSGSPFVLEEKGAAYLTEGYKGAPYGMAVKVRAIAGPFRGQYELDPIIVRQKVEVDRSSAEVSVVSDPLPTVWHGVPLRVRRVLVKIDRPGFMLNPSDCTTSQIDAALHSPQGSSVQRSERFKVGGCANLPFKPKLSLALTGRKQVTTGKHPGINAQVTQQGVSEAGIERAIVRLPKSLALDPNNAQALCEFTDGTKPDLENHCPKGSIVGRARAKTPLLKDDLVGNVYFVKNVRIDPKTRNQIRTLPMIIVALRGEIAINLKGESSTTKGGKLVNTFASVPDAPISRFNLNIKGGGNGIIAVTRTRKAKINLCAGRHIAETDMDAQNGRRHDFDVRMKTPCTKKQTRNAKRAARRAAARR